jgi:hypothetical protein
VLPVDAESFSPHWCMWLHDVKILYVEGTPDPPDHVSVAWYGLAVVAVAGTLSELLFRKRLPTCVSTTPALAGVIVMLTFAVIDSELAFR